MACMRLYTMLPLLLFAAASASRQGAMDVEQDPELKEIKSDLLPELCFRFTLEYGSKEVEGPCCTEATECSGTEEKGKCTEQCKLFVGVEVAKKALGGATIFLPKSCTDATSINLADYKNKDGTPTLSEYAETVKGLPLDFTTMNDRVRIKC
mmetsp:Transcript_45006/g.83991  ORF Transcript_45006/g.83991 Transcript_45006/m.83991 type:complete len:152 (-) Transcript_45006:168-623(-)